MDRLSDSLIDDRGDVRYELLFAKDSKICTVTGQVEAVLCLECSVCMNKMIYAVRTETGLAIVSSLEEAARLPGIYEPLLVVDRQTRIKEIIEEELLLAIPIIPRHEECTIAKHGYQSPRQNAMNPFSILAELKLTGDQ
ncbi:MAG: YceD family protein [Methylococcaceae bacterium]|nr:YceD family protein [Methylococcaceae bacterium]